MEFAIIGVAIRLPGVGDIDQFHTNLLAGRSGLREVSPEDSLRNGVTEAEIVDPRYVPVAAPVESGGAVRPGILCHDRRGGGLHRPAASFAADPGSRGARFVVPEP